MEAKIIQISSSAQKYYKNTVISPNFLEWTFAGKTQFLHRFGQFAVNYEKIVPFHKIFILGNYVKLLYYCSW